ncbi:NACHT domain-containing protein [Polaromonas sp. CT11-55]|uniref:NACHT domain-containing protein n=1 Tax=Polaromonas sp. CT11-55 TaxID=3243045 RepID=UPI0039A41ACB
MATTLEIGDKFRDAVAALLRTQFPDVKTEQLIDGTKVDITFTEHTWGKSLKCAVECKNYEGALTKADFQEIFSKYEPMVQTKSVDKVLIVSRKAISAPAEGYLGALPAYAHLTFEVLAEQLFGIRGVVEKLREAKKSSSSRYIQARFEEHSEPAFEAIEKWIAAPDNPGLAVLGGYGQGKTSLAEQVAAYAADKYLADPTNRIPILIRLGEVVHETQLEGLFGKEFTAKHNVSKYHFDTLMHLNQLGRLLIILDGFDEMKHAMSAHDFEANFREFNRLLTGRAKVMLLGRPSALPSEERELVFKGRKRIGSTTIQSPHYKPWLEWRLSFFTKEEAVSLLQQVLIVALGHDQLTPSVSSRTDDVMNHVPHDLLKRPVHVVLIAEAAADPVFDFNGFDEYTLYSHFVKEMVKRDQIHKRARREIPLENRLTFQRDLAWWAWARAGVSQGSFYRDDVPPELLEALPDGGATDIEAKQNEYIVSTLTDEKEAGVLYFSHRSFQEFLVAERMILVSNTSTHTSYSRFLNQEISNFIGLAPDKSFLDKWYATLTEQTGLVGLNYLAIFSRSSEFMERLWMRIESDPGSALPASTLAILLLAFAENKVPTEWAPKYQRLLRDEIEAGAESSAAVAVMSYLALYGAQNGDSISASELVSSILVRALNFAAANKVGSQQPGADLLIPTKTQDFLTKWIENDLRRENHPDNRYLVWRSGTGYKSTLWELTAAHLESSLLLSSDIDDGWKRIPLINEEPAFDEIELPINLVYQKIPKQARSEYSQFLNATHRHFKIVGTDRRGAAAGRRHVIAPFSTRTESPG